MSQIPAGSLNVVNYAFADITATGEVGLYDRWAAVDKPLAGGVHGNLGQLLQLKQANPGLLTMISVGGWTLSSRFSDVALTDASRQKFSQSAVAFMVLYGFDGVDIDWEYPGGGGLDGNANRPQDPHNFTLLLQELRRQIDAQGDRDGRRYYLSAALPAGGEKIARLECSQLSGRLDWMNLMTYDFHGGWENRTQHHAPLYSSDGVNASAAVDAYLRAGVPAAKLLLGIPAYGRAWKNVGPTQFGLGQPASGLPQGSWEVGVFDYKDLMARVRSAPQVWVRHLGPGRSGQLALCPYPGEWPDGELRRRRIAACQMQVFARQGPGWRHAVGPFLRHARPQ